MIAILQNLIATLGVGAMTLLCFIPVAALAEYLLGRREDTAGDRPRQRA
jgi:hypothetical protein